MVLMITSVQAQSRELLAAAETGRSAEVSRLIAAGVRSRGARCAGPNRAAARSRRQSHRDCQGLAGAGASPNTQAANRDTPWLLAGASGRTEIIAAMLPLKPDLSIRNRYGGNALIPACERAHVETVKLLLTSGIDVDHVNDLGWTCLLEIVILGDGGHAIRRWQSSCSAPAPIPASPTRTASRRSGTPASAASAPSRS
jgi:hypothetical protein